MSPMNSISVNLALAGDPELVWLALRDFAGPAVWDDTVAFLDIDGHEEGDRRTIIRSDGSRSIERLEEIDDGKRSIRFSTVYTTASLDDRSDRITVNSPEEDRCVVSWVTGFVIAEGEVPEIRRALAVQNMNALRSLERHVAVKSASDLTSG